MKSVFALICMLVFIGCASKTPIQSQSATILIKTPAMKFYDKGFITYFDNHTQVQIYSAGQTVLDLKIYENQVCQSTFECLSLEAFNKTYMHASYPKDFIKSIFAQGKKESIFRDRKNGVLIKIKKD